MPRVVRTGPLSEASRSARRLVGVSILCALAVLGASCGGGDDADLSSAAVSSGLQPTEHGFAFANFPSIWYPEEFEAEDVVAMFGSGADVCVDGSADPCTLTAEAAAFARLVNQSRAVGHCEGLVAVSQARFNAGAEPATAALLDDVDIIKAILRAFATQFLPEVRSEVKRWISTPLVDKVEAIRASIAEGRLEYSLGVYTEEGGHAVLPFAVEYPAKDRARIMVYDSNWPGRNRYVDVDLRAGTWSFSFSGDDPGADPDIWVGDASKMDLTSIDARSGSCPFCSTDVGVSKNVLLVRSTNLDWSVDSGGQTVGPETPGSDGTGVVVTPVKGQGGGNRSTYDYVIELPSGGDGELSQLNLPGLSSVFALTPSGIAQISTPGNPDVPVQVGSNSFVSADPAVTLSVASGNLVASASGPSAKLSIGSGTLAASVTTSDGRTVDVAVTPDAPAAKIEVDPTKGGVTVLAQAADGQTERREVASDGSVTVSVEATPLDLNSTSWKAPPGLESAPLPMLPSPDARNLNNPDYKVDEPYRPPTATTAATTTTVRPAPTTTTVPPTTTTVPPATTVPPTTTTAAPVPPGLSVAALPTVSYGAAPFDVAVSSNSPGVVSFASSAPSVATVSSAGRVTVVGAGSTTITVSQAAAGNFAAATVARTLTVDRIDQPTLAVDSVTGVVGTALELRTTGGGGTGAVTFALDGVATGCTLTGSTLERTTGGTCTVVATKAADANHRSATSAPTIVTFVDLVHGTAEEGEAITLTAPAGTRFSGVRFASYGTPEGLPGSFRIGGCHASTSVAEVEALVAASDGTTVTIQADNNTFGDPCGGTYKRLAVTLELEVVPG